MIGMLVASISQTIVGPAMPRIVAELGGMDHYSWLATSAMLVSAVTVPIVGKLSDMYGRRRFYLGGLVIFMLGSVMSGAAQSFGFLIFARSVQGLGMGTLMPLSQTIIGDIIPPRFRGKYQGYMGAVFGVTSVAGPLAGGWITDHFGWRWLFYVTLPLGIAALAVIAKFLHIEHTPRKAKIDYLGMTTMTIALLCLLLATSLGGTSYPWGSAQIITLYVVGALMLLVFLFVERTAIEPVLPLRLFSHSTVALCCLAAFGINMMMFGATIYIPVFAQGAMGVSATSSGAILVPMSVAMITTSILVGLYISKTGSYKAITTLGIIVLGGGLVLLTLLNENSAPLALTGSMIVIGLGMGASMQVYTLLVQNVVARTDLGVATAAIQFFRNVGATVGIAVFGTIMTTRMAVTIPAHLPPGAASRMPEGAGQSVGSVLDPSALSSLPPMIADAIRAGLSDAITTVFVAALPIAAIVLIATLLIKNQPLRETVG